MTGEPVLLVEDDAELRKLLCEELEGEGLVPLPAADLAAAKALLAEQPVALVISDLRLPDGEGTALLPLLDRLTPRPAMLLITAFGTVRQAVDALRAGADDFLTKPLDFDHLQLTVRRLLAARARDRELDRYRELLAMPNFHGLYGSSEAMQGFFERLRRVARAQGPVLLLGESGTGKELAARAVHAESGRHDGPFLAVNCGAIPGELLESEFFGHLSGAFTGARSRRPGLLQEADGGTLFLDEIGEMPSALQAKLLRVLEDGSFRAVGSDQEQKVDVRIVAATHRDIEAAVAEGSFREDLYYRLETFALRLPPLRERGEDWLALTRFFLTRLRQETGSAVTGLSPAALDLLATYPFPGNVRELQNILERAVAFCDGRQLEPEHLPARVQERSAVPGPAPGAPWDDWPTLDTLQQRYLHRVLEHVAGNKQQAARILGVTRRTLYRWLEDHGPAG
ncbi:sigma-54-dependent transcriptional regulator [Pseudohaliea rubra]|uniref:Two component, sigma54 specific, transcriptional regulator, Fis family n=1 Tax=Pseudohaliea rubra DSM 19751 TaxID=1265313 RepID=A0A095VN06_9GAMM|nr:sigma-54 dependent transcriptional regulator [Pseudohaliea rubra]KGE02755.1 two component, sigma54 specific, transcriptional regulator, Fis family [Pseudohaliea rubra DSM 19751]